MPIQLNAKAKSACLLPMKPVKRTGMPDAPIFLSVAPPGWGKTEFAMSNKKCLLVACQRGHEDVDGFKVIITSWDTEAEPYERNGIMYMSFTQLVKQLVSYGDDLPYDFIAIDTLDDLVKMLVDESLSRIRVKHLSDMEYGKGWDLGQNTPFRKVFNKLNAVGLGCILITHEDTSEKIFKGIKKAKKETTLPGGIYKLIFPMVTAVLHGVFGRKRKGKDFRDRIIVTEGSEAMLAKNRYGALPIAWLVDPDINKRWEQFTKFWGNKELCKKAFTDLQELGFELDDF